MDKLTIIASFGKPCSGKGTLAGNFVSKFSGYKEVDTGAVFRGARDKEGEFAKYHEDLKEDFERVNNGLLVRDENMIRAVKKIMREYIFEKEIKNFVFSGFPRTTEQYVFFRKMLGDLGTRFNITETYFRLGVSDEIVQERAENRIKDDIANGNRPRLEDMGDNFKTRLETFKRETLPMIEYIDREGNLVEIDASRTPEEIFTEALLYLEGIHPGKERR